MPPDVEVYKITAGGVTELMDEWNDKAKGFIQDALKQHLAKRFGFEIKFIDEEWLKREHKELWNSNRALYNAVATSALSHAYAMSPNAFPDKVKNFDYTLGEKLQNLAQVCEADALLFIYGFDYEATAGRNLLLVWNILLGASVIPINPSAMMMGLVDGRTGDVTWFKTTPFDSEYSFRSNKDITTIIEWLTRDLMIEKK